MPTGKNDIAESSMIRLEDELKQSRNKKVKIAIIAGIAFIAILTIILVLALKKSPDNNN